MSALRVVSVVPLIFAGLLPSLWAEVRLNEAMSSNRSTFEDPQRPGEFDDWIELHNTGVAPVRLEGWSLADHARRDGRWVFPAEASIEPGGYLLVQADGEPEEGPLHADFRLRASGEVLSLFDASGEPVDAIALPPLEPDVAYGRAEDGASWCRLGAPTPGASNGRCSAGRPSFSREEGTFVESFALTLSSEVPDAVIHYSLDGSEPGAGSPRFESPIRIERSLRLRAQVTAPGHEPGPIVSAVWMRLAEELRDFESNLPLVLLDSHGVDVDATSDPNRARPFRPVLSVFHGVDEASGRASLVGATPDAAVHGGLHVRGQSTSQYPKKQYAFESWDEANEDRAIEMFGLPAEADWILQAPYSDKTLMRNFLMYRWSNRLGRYAVRTRFVEVFFNDRGAPEIAGRDYRGVYVLMEKIERDPNRVNLRRLDPADLEEPAISGGYLLKRDWLGGAQFFRTRTYGDGLIWVDPPRRELARAQAEWIEDWVNEFEVVLRGASFADSETGYAEWIDVESFIDHHLLVEMARNVDGFVLSTYMSKDREGPLTMGPIWDYNGALGGADYFCSFVTEGWHHEFDERDCNDGSETFPADNPNGYRWYARLFEDPAFRERYVARWLELRSGPLRSELLLDDIDATVELLRDGGAPDNPVRRNFERWSILSRRIWPNFFVSADYEENVEWMRSWLAGRLEWMDSALVPPPVFSHPGGRVEEGFSVEITAGGGEIFFTQNGPDPRAEGGTVAADARSYEGPIVIRENTRLRARLRLANGSWSELVEATWITRAPGLIVTELLYDPPSFEGDRFLRSRYEFIELYNKGTEPIELAGFRLLRLVGDDRALRFDFSASAVPRLEPDAFLVLPRHAEAFRERYGPDIPIAGVYSGSFRDQSDTVLLEGPLGEPVVRFTYDDDWFEDELSDGWSLTLRDPDGDPSLWNEARAWRPSAEAGGSPGRFESAAGVLVGDFNSDRAVDISDAVATLRFLFGGRAPPCRTDAANRRLLDTNGDGVANLSDAIHTLTWLFRGGAAGAIGADCQLIDGCASACE